MYRYILKRIFMLIPVLLGISLIVFSIMSLTPGDPVRLMVGDSATNEEVQRIRDEMGLNDPFFVRYFRYVKNALHGDFGESYRSKVPVYNEIFARFPNTVKLAVWGTLFSILISLPIGVISAIKQYSFVDKASLVSALLLTSMPSFWLGLMLVLLFSLKLDLLPATGVDSWLHFVLPSITAAAPTVSILIRMTRSTMLEVIRQDYIRTARAKGATERIVVLRHALRNALLPIVTVIGINFGFLIGGAMIAETVFAIPGLGTLLISSVRMKDTPMVMASVLFVAILISLVNLVIDIVYGYIDPRIRSEYARH